MGGVFLNSLEKCRLELYQALNNSMDFLSPRVLEKSQELDKLILECMKGGSSEMIDDCKICENKGTEVCKKCAETSGGKPSHFKPIDNKDEARAGAGD
jgi:hypothetical protein